MDFITGLPVSDGLTKAKLAARKIGPFQIEHIIIENVAKLILPRNLKRLHSSFNVDLLSHFVESPDRFDSRPIPKAIPVILTDEGEELHLVEKLLKKLLEISTHVPEDARRLGYYE
ncbi:TPA: hypothetical protein N0F65_004209 [Lagenidium giganteum]|uniref:Tf2-1-like SH3-like domain-containing protein n=1 Tax=Lagenidium giganteum TaxID=4803 RepID=A0AAV2YIM3_9STRA|nr:TPA: hypothetical protein N0F65_004209 [Lagenidium giganteum]